MQKVKKGVVVPSAAYSVKSTSLRFYQVMPDHVPQVGDVVYGKIVSVGQHSNLENKSARIHMIHNGSHGFFVFGHRYAPDYYEGIVPTEPVTEVDLLARSGVIGQVEVRNSLVKDPTKVEILGYVCTADGTVVNTMDYNLISPKKAEKTKPRAKLILVCGTSMNSGKSMAAASCCWALSNLGYTVNASKVTGTASLKDILSMNDAGASKYLDFTSLGHPSTYKLNEESMLSVFNTIDLKYANNPQNYWVVEFADGILQRETAMLLAHEDVRSRIHKLIFCSYDAFGAVGGLQVLKEKFNLVPDAISGVCSSSPLHLKELAEFSDIPIFNSADANLDFMKELLCSKRKKRI
ncbi:MAG: hypothetical protein ACI9E5_000063 [Candidatus Omnitrophota bacterium]|jgi:hypothetical protein